MWTVAEQEDVDWLGTRLWAGEEEVLGRIRELLLSIEELTGELRTGQGSTDRVAEVFAGVCATWHELLSAAQALGGIVRPDGMTEAEEEQAGQLLACMTGLAVSAEQTAALFLDSLGEVVAVGQTLGEALAARAEGLEGLAPAALAGFGSEAERADLFMFCYDWFGPESMSVIREVLSSLQDRTSRPDPSDRHGADPLPMAFGSAGFEAYQRPESVGFHAAEAGGLPLHEEYRGEEHGQGWRAREVERTALSTLYVALEDRDSYRATLVDGAVVLADGTALPPGSTRGWVLSEGEELYVFDEFSAQFLDENGELVETRVMDSLDEARPHIAGGGRVRLTHHSSVVGGAAVVAAGMIAVDRAGKLTVDNWSGHYRPEATNIGVAARILVEKHGLDPNTDVVLRGDNGSTGRPVPGLEGIYAVRDQIRDTADGWDNPYDAGDTTVPAGVMADLGEHADITSIKFRDRVVAQLKREAADASARTQRDPGTTGSAAPSTTSATTPVSDGSESPRERGNVYE
ncbi:hypothetical protein ABZW32_24440 [Streptomyces sp. NPDC004667]|uniref:hypothetical protein n=1 Tax=Streptomyces sp. NPDC004667 TaxID=3154285 RepID=UPI0033B9B0A7